MIANTEEFKNFENEFQENSIFLRDFSILISTNGRIINFASKKGVRTVNTALLESSIRTLESIKNCASLGNFSDTNTLIRKLRDDLLLYAYKLAVINKRQTFTEESLKGLSIESQEQFSNTFLKLEFNEMSDDEQAIEAWLSNSVEDVGYKIKKKLSFENYMTFLKQDSNIERILTEYNLDTYWKFLTKNLNNHVHNNGYHFTLHNLVKPTTKDLEVFLKNVNIRVSYIVTFFLILIIMIESSLLSSGDAIDYLESDLEIPEGCQYEIAPFIQKYIDDKVVTIHPELKNFLRDNNPHGMTIE